MNEARISTTTDGLYLFKAEFVLVIKELYKVFVGSNESYHALVALFYVCRKHGFLTKTNRVFSHYLKGLSSMSLLKGDVMTKASHTSKFLKEECGIYDRDRFDYDDFDINVRLSSDVLRNLLTIVGICHGMEKLISCGLSK